MTKEDIANNCFNLLMQGMYKKLKLDNVLDKVKDGKAGTTDCSSTIEGVYFDSVLMRRNRIGWYFYLEIENKDYGIAVDLLHSILPITQTEAEDLADDWSIIAKDIFLNKKWDEIKVDEEFLELAKQ